MDVFGNRSNAIIMTFNPFKTTSSTSSKSSPHHVSDNESWHSQPTQSVSSGPMSWFSSGWTSSATQSIPPTDANVTYTSPLNALAAPVSPTESMIMLRASHSEGDMNTTGNFAAASQERTNYRSNINRSTANKDIGDDLPSYPETKIQQQQHHRLDSTNEKLLEEFRPKANRTLIEDFPSKHNKRITAANAINNTDAARNRMKPCIGEIEESYPGFAMYQTARMHYYLGNYNEALEATTECLAFQKLAIGSAQASNSSPKLLPQSISAANPARTNEDDGKNGMTALDLRSTFVTEVRDAVQSMKTSSTTNATKRQSQSSPHPALSNSMATMIAQYPLHPCIAQTLLLRGRVLVDCGLYGLDCDGDTDFSLLLQAIRNIEMSVAILRKLDHEFDLAKSLTLLGTLRTMLGHHDEADRTYEEALSIFRGLRLAIKYNQAHVTDEEADAMSEQLKRVNDGTANVLYRRGKLFQSRRMYEEAFRCYHRALLLFQCNGASRQDICVRRIIQCMKSRSAIERILSTYVDDHSVV